MVRRLDESPRQPTTYEIDYQQKDFPLLIPVQAIFIAIGILFLSAARSIYRLNPKIGLVFLVVGFMSLARPSIIICQYVFHKRILWRAKNFSTKSPVNSATKILP